MTEAEAAQVQEYHAHRAAHLQAQLTKTCDADKKQEEHLALVAKHKARMAESRARSGGPVQNETRLGHRGFSAKGPGAIGRGHPSL